LTVGVDAGQQIAVAVVGGEVWRKSIGRRRQQQRDD